ncbi:hypothetical protein AJ80_07760 [Polytolypa hystricis UAMH7299]|uniref:Kri1-like C-terminal domain-containing protein n=1 Tax=Polytolypa hystricis (strain UAMH7299) TaxID=1447883 RepID=A0A2B7XJ67_POLH7|nr:hypothetical protein AJ80_07760 [Polytolypa hystricis UAMH7299]
MEPPAKKQRKVLFDDASDDDSDQSFGGGARLLNGDAADGSVSLKINEEYAKRFEYNKKREELAKLEEKFGKSSSLGKRKNNADGTAGPDYSEEESSSDEDEDDIGELATEALDSEIMATLQAIRSKDPKVYNPEVTFYSEIKDDEPAKETKREEKPMFLRDYHRENLLRGTSGKEDEEDEEDAGPAPKSFAEQQEDLKTTVVREMHAAADEDVEDEVDSESDDGGFLIPKTKTKPVKPAKKLVELDVATADKDPENFLSNFMAARAWVAQDRPNWQPFESDDEEHEKQAEAFEEAYNLRFEDPNKMNEVMVTHARDTTSKFSVRREALSGRKKLREAEKMRKEEENRERDEERARLRKLKIEQLQERVQKVKKAAGLRATDLAEEDWARFMDDGWDDAKWEEEMKKRFGEEYYAEQDYNGSDGEDAGSSKKRRPKKPTWDDDIDIKDLVPDFEEEETGELDGVEAGSNDEDDARGSGSNKKRKLLQDKRDKQREARKERRKIEQLVDQNLTLEDSLLPKTKRGGFFRYREASPVSFGLTARDILMADDTQLNQFAGLKKLASFRDPEKKRRDRKRMGKKARVREWRRDTFGNEDGPAPEVIEKAFQPAAPADAAGDDDEGMKVDIREGGKKKRKRSKKH